MALAYCCFLQYFLGFTTIATNECYVNVLICIIINITRLCIDHYQRLHSLDFTINLSLVHDSLLYEDNGKVTKSMRCKYLTLSEYNRKRGMKSRVSRKNLSQGRSKLQWCAKEKLHFIQHESYIFAEFLRPLIT